MTDRPLRLAAYGLVEKDAGGLASATRVVLDHRLRAGPGLDFCAVDPWVRPAALFAYPNFRYVGFRLPAVERGWGAAERHLAARPTSARGLVGVRA